MARLSLVALTFCAAAAAACNDNNTTKLQYVPDMADAPVVRPQRDFIAPPDHAVATTAIIYPATIEESEKTLKNPVPANPQTLERGQFLYEQHCIPCHGMAGKGDGSITDVYPVPPDITSDINVNRGDGFFFHKITFGGAIMPGYGHSITPVERWLIVHHIRTLQKAGK